MNRVFINQVGIWSCLGRTTAEVAENLFNKKIGIMIDDSRDYFISPLCGNVPKVECPRRLSMSANYAIQSIVMQMHNLPKRLGMIYGNDSCIDATVAWYKLLQEKQLNTKITSEHLFKGLSSNINILLSEEFGINTINLSIGAACASSAHAIGLSYILIKNGYVDSILTGGAQESSPVSHAAFDSLRVFSKYGCRPFDENRDGLVPSGGAASLLLQSHQEPTACGEIVGYGFSNNPTKTTPDWKGYEDCMTMALKDAGLNPEDIDYINAHATGTYLGDKEEAKAIYGLFGDTVPVTSTKAQTGHEMWMCGASEIIYSLLMAYNGVIVPQLSFIKGDSITGLINIPTKEIYKDIKYIMSNSFGFGGTNCSLIIKRI